jgi:hypothetical protein
VTHQATNPALAVLGLLDVKRKTVGQVRESIDQRIAEGRR